MIANKPATMAPLLRRYKPATKAAFKTAIKYFQDDELRSCGFVRIADGLWLIPATWFDRIPEGFPVVSIYGRRGYFNRSILSQRATYGRCLGYGIRR